MDIWDLYYRQNEFAYSHKVSDCALTCIKLNFNSQEKGFVNMQGKLVAIGDQDGVVTLIELCDSLSVL
jgi:dynein intermediate chain 2